MRKYWRTVAVAATFGLGFALPVADASADGPTVHAFAGDRVRSGPALEVGQLPHGIAAGGGGMDVSDENGRVLRRYDASTGRESTIYGDGLYLSPNPTHTGDPLQTAFG